MDFKKYLRILVKNDGSDLYLTFNAPPSAKFQGEFQIIVCDETLRFKFQTTDNQSKRQKLA